MQMIFLRCLCNMCNNVQFSITKIKKQLQFLPIFLCGTVLRVSVSNDFDELFVADMHVFGLKPTTDPLNLVKLELLLVVVRIIITLGYR